MKQLKCPKTEGLLDKLWYSGEQWNMMSFMFQKYIYEHGGNS